MLFTLTGSTVWDNRCFKYQSKLQIPQGLQQSDEEDELYEEVEDTRKQSVYMVLPLLSCSISRVQSLHYIIMTSQFLIKGTITCFIPPLLECERWKCQSINHDKLHYGMVHYYYYIMINHIKN